MSKIFIETIDRGDGKKLHLYSQNKAKYKTFSGLPPVEGNQTHLRFHPTRSEWVAYSTSRQNRTFLPNAMECPLCPMDSEEKASDIPVDQYEVAIFTNRFSSLRMEETHVPELEISTQSATGTCDVISYSSNHKDQFSELPQERIELILKAVAHRSKELFNNSQIEYVLPFENKGKEIGVTLEHPHGQIYSFGHIPETIIRQSENQIQNPLLETIAQIPKELILLENKSGVCFVPRWARYPFEIWVVPHRRVSQVYNLDDEEIKNLSHLLLESSKMLDKVFNEPMPYTLAWQLAPKGYQDSHHLHWCFQPIKRSKTKLKYLAGVEQITGFYLVDLPLNVQQEFFEAKSNLMSSAKLFLSFFQKEPSITTSAHGRVNLIGEHTDYNYGFVLPSLIPQSLQVSISLRNDDKIIGISSEFGELQSSISSPNDGTWLDFVRGAIYFCQKISPYIKGMNVAVSSSIPSGSGLSSSAALEIALLRAISQLKDLSIQSEEMAKIGQQIEHQFVGTQCGIMDQMASACGTFGQAIFLDCENLQTKSIPVFSHHSFVIIHSGSTRKLSHGKYNERKNETSKASEILEVPSLRHATIDQLMKIKDPIIKKRAKHIISENDRVLKAVSCLEQDDPISFGKLMNSSHHSMRDDYEISSNELNQVVESSNKNGALGARLTGAGFGGCVVILTANDELSSVSKSVLEDCPQAYLVTTISKELNS